jgi:4-carboxymuconolactone decarboxylase
MEKPMVRVPFVERDDLPEAARPAYDHVAQSRGAAKMPNVFKAIANSPAVLERLAAMGELVRFQTNLDPVLRELIILTTAQESHSPYEWTQHWGMARKLGASPDLLKAIGTAEIERETAPVGPALRFARLVARGEEVDDNTFEVLRKSLGNSGMVELTALVGYYGMLARMLNVLRVPLDAGIEVVPFVVSSR